MLLSLPALAQSASKPAASAAAPVATETPEQLVQRQLDAYNARDIDKFAATYAENVELIDFSTGKVGLTGRAKLAESYAKFFASAPKLNCIIKHRAVHGNRIVDHEYVTGLPNGKTAEATAVYEVENGLIRRVTFIR